MMTQPQRDLLDRLEVGLARMCLDGRRDLSLGLGPVVEALHDGHTVFAALLADRVAPDLAAELRHTFGVLEFR